MKKLIVANWKMNPDTRREAERIFTAIKRTASKLRNVQTVVCPPHIFLDDLKRRVSGHRCVLGAQDVFYEESGAYTGEISASQIKNSGALYVIIGHSERRALGETDEIVNKKVKIALKNGLTPILCVGERERDEKTAYLNFVTEQLKQSLKGITKTQIKEVVVAYEPIWAIGKGAKRSATTEESREMTIFIKKVLSDMFGVKSLNGFQILYGGSVNAKNARAFLEDAGVDGLLVGRDSLDPEKFGIILKDAN